MVSSLNTQDWTLYYNNMTVNITALTSKAEINNFAN